MISGVKVAHVIRFKYNTQPNCYVIIHIVAYRVGLGNDLQVHEIDQYFCYHENQPQFWQQVVKIIITVDKEAILYLKPPNDNIQHDIVAYLQRLPKKFIDANTKQAPVSSAEGLANALAPGTYDLNIIPKLKLPHYQ
jgi:hypothetical protein